MSPFEIFRRNLKPLMVLLTGLALFAFVVLPAMDSYMRQGGGGGMTDATVASFDGKPLKRSRVEYFTRNHQSTARFLRELAEETIQRGGAPQTPGFVYDTQSRQIRSIGIDERPSELATVRTLQFANEAKKAGFELDDTAIASWLYSFTDQGVVSEGEMLAMLMDSTRNQMGKYHLYEQLRNQLLAELYQRGNVSGLSVGGQFPVVTPVEQWENFLKLNRQATATTYGLLVSDYLDQTNDSPTQAAIEEVYEAGKDRYPNEQSSDPAFRRRETATFEYLVADRGAFIDREAKKISEEELREEYEKRKAGGDFQMPESAEDVLGLGADTDAEDEVDVDPDAADDGDQDATESDEDSAADGDAKSEKMDSDKESADGKAAKEESDKKEKAEKKSSKPKKADRASEEKASAKESDVDSSSGPKADDQSGVKVRSAVRLVVFQDDEKAEGGDEAVENPNKKTKKSGDKKSGDEANQGDAKKKAEPPKKGSQANKDGDGKDAESEKDDASEKDRGESDKDDAGEESDDEGSNDEGTKSDAGDKSDDADQEMTAEESSEKDATEDSAEEKEPKVESFEDVREQIARELAEPKAREQIETAANEIASKMRRYFNLKAIHESNVKIDRPSEAPTKPDLEALAKEYSMQYELIGPHDIVSLRNEPIAQSSEFSSQMSQPGPPFSAMMFGVSNNQGYIPKQQLYSPLKTSDLASGKTYVTWKTEESEAYTPELDEVRDEVILAIRMEEARELARVEAVRLADEANEGKDLAKLIPEDKKSNLLEGLGPFSWMNSFGFGGAFLGNVPELDSVGEEFMAETFRTKEGQHGVAANLPERVVYIVKPTGFQPSLEELRRRFKQPRERMMAMLLGTEEVQSVMRGFYESVDERTGFDFVVPEEE